MIKYIFPPENSRLLKRFFWRVFVFLHCACFQVSGFQNLVKISFEFWGTLTGLTTKLSKNLMEAPTCRRQRFGWRASFLFSNLFGFDFRIKIYLFLTLWKESVWFGVSNKTIRFSISDFAKKFFSRTLNFSFGFSIIVWISISKRGFWDYKRFIFVIPNNFYKCFGCWVISLRCFNE